MSFALIVSWPSWFSGIDTCCLLAMTGAQESKPSWASVFLYSVYLFASTCTNANLITKSRVSLILIQKLGHDKTVDDIGRVKEIRPIIK